ncbi:MAG: hypothetical protein NTZ49_05850 [Candidatus Parcubacteria bacterium]|nr:hypothetical protein [Candidatus Parcubacteria bacterium]
MKAAVLKFIAEERNRLLASLTDLQAKKVKTAERVQLQKKLRRLCQTAKKDNSPEITEQIIQLLENLRDLAKLEYLDKAIGECEQLISAFNRVLAHFGYEEEKKEPKVLPAKADSSAVNSSCSVTKQLSAKSCVRDRAEILRRIVLCNMKDDKAPLDVVFEQLKAAVALPSDYNYNHLAAYLNRLRYSVQVKKNIIVAMGPKVTRRPIHRHNYRDKILALFLYLGPQKQLSRDELKNEGVRLGLFGDNNDFVQLYLYLNCHVERTLQENRLFARATEPLSIDRGSNRTYMLTVFGKKLLAEHEDELILLLGQNFDKSQTEKGA